MSSNLNAALALYNQGRFRDAEFSLRDYLTKTSSDPNAFQLAAMIANKLGNFDEAMEFIQKSLQLNDLNHEIWNIKGNIEAKTGNEHKAVSSFVKSLSLNPKYTSAQQNLAFLYNKLQAPRQALELFDKLLRKKPSAAHFILGKVQALTMAERSNEAIVFLEEMRDHLQNDIFLYTRAQASFALGDYSSALEIYKTIPEESSYFIPAKRNIFQILHLTGQIEEIKSLLNEDAKTQPSSEEYALKLEIVEKVHDRDFALNYVETKITSYQNNPYILSRLASIDIDNQNYISALENSERALSLIPDHTSFLPNKVTAAIGIGQYDMADNIIANQLNRTPNNQYWIAMHATLKRLKGENYTDLYDYSEFVKSYEIPIPEGYSQRSEYLSALNSALLDLHEYDAEPLDQSLRRGTQTRANLVHLKSPELEAFFTSIDLCIGQYVRELPDDQKHPLLRRKTPSPRIISAWSVMLKGTGYHVNHVHPEGWISSAFYVDVPKGIEQATDKKGWIKFGEPSFKVKDLEAEHFIAPTSGKLVLFPSYMWHGTIPTDKNSSRLTLPFDVLPI